MSVNDIIGRIKLQQKRRTKMKGHDVVKPFTAVKMHIQVAAAKLQSQMKLN